MTIPVLSAHRFSGFMLLAMMTTSIGFASPFNATAQEKSDANISSPQDQKALVVAQTATNAQNAGDYELAANQWEKLLADFPESSLVGKAHYNAGVCQVQLQKYEPATVHLSAAIPKLAGNETLQPQAYLYLGFCQYRLGQAAASQNDDASQKRANTLLTTSTQTFANLLDKFPDFVDADQAAFFQGGAFEDLGRLKDALKSYQQMLTFPKQTFKFDGLFAIANVNEQLGKYTQALKHYETFRDEAEREGGHPLLREVNFHTAKTHLGLAEALSNQNKQKQANQHYSQAQKLFQKIPERSPFADESQYQAAYCLSQLGTFNAAAKLYEKIAASKTSPFRNQALVNAGFCYMRADKNDLAIATLSKALVSHPDDGLKAAAALTRLYLETNQPQATYDLAEQWIPQADDSPLLPGLMLDQADAAYQIKKLRSQAAAMYLAVADQFPKHENAPVALYNAAYALLEANKLEQAIDATNRFEKNFPQHDFLTDTREVKADAMLLSNDSAGAEKAFDQLLSDNADHDKAPRWLLRSALSKYLQQKYQPVIDLLKPRLALLSGTQLAEAEHWIGSSQFNLDQFQPAVEHLQKSIDADPNWRSADETLLTLARAQSQTQQADAALATIDRLLADHPKSALVSKAHYYLGEHFYDSGKFNDAFKHFSIVIEKHTESDLAPLALYNAAWAKLKLNAFEESEKLFSQLIEEFPDHKIASEAKIGRGAARRKTGNTGASIADLTTFLKTKPTGQAKFSALYELGLAQVEQKQWSAAVKTFQQLLDEQPDSPRAARYHYELAWAHQSQNHTQLALKHFRAIAEKHSNSPLASEANFHVGNAAYQNQKWAAAIAAFEKSVAAKPKDPIQENAWYKLGWAHFKQQQYDAAAKSFSKQIEQFPDGELYADGVFMIAESQFRLDQFSEALQSYLVAKPAVDAAPQVDPKIPLLTMLHGAQAANKTGEYEQALELATPITVSDASESFQHDAWLEIGYAHVGLKQDDHALGAWKKAAEANNVTGIRAGCMIGDVFFRQKKFDEAITQYKLIYYRFVVPNVPDEIQPWLAYALYESARCHFVQIKSATDNEKQKHTTEAIKQFETLLKNFPDDKLAPESKKQLERLRKL